MVGGSPPGAGGPGHIAGIRTFDALPLSDATRAVLAELGFDAPTAIQSAAIPPLLAGRDVVGRAATGSGKTLAFGVPLLERLHSHRGAPQALVLCPTRELAAQVAATLRTLGRRRPGLRVVVLAGGEPGAPQARTLEQGAHVVVGTPGRILDHLRRGTLDPRSVRVVVLDEADRMLELGFREQVEEILANLPEDRQTALFSATFPEGVTGLSVAFQRDAVTVAVADAPPPEIRQEVAIVERDGKPDALVRLLARDRPDSALVFCATRENVRALGAWLRSVGVGADELHGELMQTDRDRVLAKLRNGSTRVLVATDVAARGLDVSGLDAVYNVDLPSRPEVYVHRIGRTGRMGRLGLAVTLATPRDERRLAEIEAFTGVPFRRVLMDVEPMGSGDASEREGAASRPPPPLARHLPPAGGGPDPSAAETTGDTTPDGPASDPSRAMATLRVAGGRKDKLRPGDVLGALTGEGVGLAAAEVGRIEIQERVTWVAVALEVAAKVADLGALRVKGRRYRIEHAR